MHNSDKQKSLDNFKLGQFKTKMIVNEALVEVLIEPLSQSELAEDWQLVLPKKTKNNTRHHFNIYLSQLPQHLWHHLLTDDDKYYKLITDNIYSYSVKVCETDTKLYNLFNMINSKDYRVYLTEINNLYSELYKENVRGWVMIKTKKLLG